MLDKVNSIRELRIQLFEAKDQKTRTEIREKIDKAMLEKQRAFKKSAKDDEDFMMLN